jgi:hypothetical protein
VRGRVSVLAGVALVAAGGVAAACGVTPATPTPSTAEPTAPPSRAAPSPVQAAPKRWTTATWTPVEEPLFKVAGTTLLGVDTDGSRIVAWGETTVPDGAAPGGSRTILALWTSSAEGLTWRRHQVKRPTGEPFRVAFAAVAPSGYLVAGSSRGVPSLDVMTSVDADRWTVVGAWPEEAYEMIRSTGEGFATVGLRNGLPVVFVSSDGSAWEAIPLVSEPGRYSLSDVVHTAGGGLLLAGTVRGVPNPDGLLLGWNPDGSVVDLLRGNPMFVGPDRAVSFHKAVVHAGGIYVMGSVGEPDPVPCAGLKGRIAANGPIVADVCGVTEVAWASSDGVTWREVPGPRPADGTPDGAAEIFDIRAGAAGLVALVQEAPPGRAVGAGLWTSPDGVDWWRLGDGHFPSDHGTGGNLVALPGRLITFQERAEGITVWIGTPGG